MVDKTPIGKSLGVDIHGHWLPSVDDGAKTMDETIEIIRGLKRIGFSKIIATPHINNLPYPNDPSFLIERYYSVVMKVIANKIDIKLGLAAEYRLDDGFMDHLRRDSLLTLDDELILVEMPPYQQTDEVMNLLFEIKMRGLKPVIAHPERHAYLRSDFRNYERLRNFGCEFQINLLSVMGAYGRHVQKCAKQLLADNWCIFAATDIHSVSQLTMLKKVNIESEFQNSRFNCG